MHTGILLFVLGTTDNDISKRAGSTEELFLVCSGSVNSDAAMSALSGTKAVIYVYIYNM